MSDGDVNSQALRAVLSVLSFTIITFLLCLVPDRPGAAASSVPPQSAFTGATAQASTVMVKPATVRKVTQYSLPPNLYKKAHDLGRIYFRLRLIGFVYGLVVLWLILHRKLATKYRDWAERSSANRFLQALLFSPPLLLTIAGLILPLDVYSEMMEKRFGLSVQGWGAWSWDWVKAEMIQLVIGTLLKWLLYGMIRWSPRRWWVYFWLISLPIGVFLFFIRPWVIDPVFYTFEPLQHKDPALTVALERMVQRAGENIPPERMFWMGASETTTALNAYVTGIGASKRIVVWDTTLAKMNTPEIVFITGHEMGHYVLQHILKGLAFFALLLLLLFYLGYRSVSWVLARWGMAWGVRALDDWASLPVLLFLLSLFLFLASPISNAFSRHLEHQADQYGLEVTHGLTPDSGQLAAQAFQVLGEIDLADPDPNPVNVFLFYGHPSISDRVRFSLRYDPWSNGRYGQFVK